MLSGIESSESFYNKVKNTESTATFIKAGVYFLWNDMFKTYSQIFIFDCKVTIIVLYLYNVLISD